MRDENTKSSGTMRIPRLGGRTHEGPIYCRPNVGCPSSEVNRKRAQAQNHSSKGETTRSGRSRQNIQATTFANQLMKTARNTQQEQVNYTTKSPQSSQCFWCGGKHQQPRQQHCPAMGKKCRKWGITGHFARFCRGGTRRQAKQQQSNFVSEDTNEEAFVTESDTTPRFARKYFANLHLIHGGKTKVVRAQIDSAFTCNTIPSTLLRKLFPKADIRRTRSKINTYGSETMRPEGQVTLCCERRGRIHTIDFLVVNIPDEKPALISGRDAKALNYLKVYADETANADEEEIPHNPQRAPPLGKLKKNDVLHCYSNVFRPGRGNPLGTPMHIDLDPNVRSVHAQVSRVPWRSWTKLMKN